MVHRRQFIRVIRLDQEALGLAVGANQVPPYAYDTVQKGNSKVQPILDGLFLESAGQQNQGSHRLRMGVVN